VLSIVAVNNPGKSLSSDALYGDRGSAQYRACNSIPIPEDTTSIRVDLVSFNTVANVEFARFEVYASGVGFTDTYLDFYVAENSLLPELAGFTTIQWAQQILLRDGATPLYAPRMDEFTGDGTAYDGTRVESEPPVDGVDTVVRNPALSGPYPPITHELQAGGDWAGCS